MSERIVNLNEYRIGKIKENLARAAYWECKREDAWKALEVAEREREKALRLAGMLDSENRLGEENGIDEEKSESSDGGAASERMVRETDYLYADAYQLELDFGAAAPDSQLQSPPEDLPPAS